MGRKNLLLIFFLVIFLIINSFIPSLVLAHPGNVSSDGCHFCRTNCDSWGYTYNTRHGHHGEVCDPSKGPIDPLYSGEGYVPPVKPQIVPPTATPAPRPRPTATPTPRPRLIATPTPEPTEEPTPTLEPSPTESVSPTPTIIPSPEVKGETTKPPSRPSGFRWWKFTPLTTLLAFIFGWK